jgi:hypothetical protein
MEPSVSAKQPNRREFLALGAAAAFVTLSFRWWDSEESQDLPVSRSGPGNFAYIYSQPAEAEAFFPFLVHVFRLFPESELHALIEAQAGSGRLSDESVYRKVASQLDDIKPLLGDLTYSLPSLSQQKREMTRQTVDLLGAARRFDGYLELGTTGRYISSLEDALDVGGPHFMCHENPPTYSPVDMMERGQLSKRGEFLPMADYSTDFVGSIGRDQLDLVTVFIGFHHCPLDLRESFVGSLREAMRPGASLIVRDHNAVDERMRRVVALAHDVFNMGTRESWEYNAAELRNFYSLDTLHSMLTDFGFEGGERRLYQTGDPTHNALMLYTKR